MEHGDKEIQIQSRYTMQHTAPSDEDVEESWRKYGDPKAALIVILLFVSAHYHEHLIICSDTPSKCVCVYSPAH